LDGFSVDKDECLWMKCVWLN